MSSLAATPAIGVCIGGLPSAAWRVCCRPGLLAIPGLCVGKFLLYHVAFIYTYIVHLDIFILDIVKNL